MQAWGWRAAFFIGVLILPFGLMVRRSLPETLDAPHDVAPPGVTDRNPWGVAVLGLMLMGGATIATYVILYLTTYAQGTLHMDPRWAFGGTLCIGLGGVTGAPFGGYVSDRIGRRPVVMTSILLLMATTIPLFLVLNDLRTGPFLLAMAFYLTFVLAMGAGVGIMMIPEQLPVRIRSGAMSVIYALAIAIFGGSAQYIAEWLNQTLHDPMAPAYYMSVALCASLVGVFLMRECAPVRQKT